MGKIQFCRGYKYQLRETVSLQTRIHPDQDIKAELVELRRDGTLIIHKYFAWDGCSGPTLDDPSNYVACLGHDALYYLMRLGLLPITWRLQVDEELTRWMKEDGEKIIQASAKDSWFWRVVSPLRRALLFFRANYYGWACKVFAAGCATAKNARKIITAPLKKEE
jgi:hypothetical protein